MNGVILILGRFGWVICLSWPDWVGNGPHVLGKGNGPLVLGNGPHMLGKGLHVLGIMSHSRLCRLRYVIWDCVTFRIMIFRIMLHL